MKFLIDESADARLARYLLSIGHDVKQVARDYSPGIPDERVLILAHAEQRIVRRRWRADRR